MEKPIEILRQLCKEGQGIILDGTGGATRLNDLYTGTSEGMGDWLFFLAERREFDPVFFGGWLQHVSSALFVDGPMLDSRSIFTPAIRRDRASFRVFVEQLLSDTVGAAILPVYEPLVGAIEETVDLRTEEASVAAILSFTRQAGEALNMLITPGPIGELVRTDGWDIEKIRARQASNFHIGLHASTRILRKMAAHDEDDSDGYWEETANHI